MKKIVLLFLFLSIYPLTAQSLDNFLFVLGKIESNNRDDLIGDNGRALGRYQIWQCYFLDTKEFNNRRNNKFNLQNVKYQQVTNSLIAQNVVLAYFERYESKALKENNLKGWEVLARLHNAGPNWRVKKDKTDKYWNKVKIALQNQTYNLE